MNRIFLRVIALLFSLCSLFSCSSKQVYYIDSDKGDDTNLGTSPSIAWKSLDKLNQQIFKAGDNILFKAGTEYIGQFEPKGSGDNSAPIIVDMYGDGDKPIIHGNGIKQHTILLQGVEYWELNNLEITNLGAKTDPGRNGIIVYSWDMGDVHHIHLKYLTIRDVNGSCIKNDGAGNGIFLVNGGDVTPTRYIDLLIENCHIYNCQRNGITGQGNTNRDAWHPNLKVVFRGNLIENIPGDGIVPLGCDGALVEYNIVRDSPDLLRIEDAAAGIWPWSSDNTLIQFNEVSGQNAKWDGQAFDSDYNCRNTTIQYNFSYDNAGGMFMVCNEGNTLGKPYNIGTENSIIRHNISINDGLREYPTRPGWFSPTIHISGPAKNTLIEGNIIVVMKKKSDKIDRTIVKMDNWGGPWPENTSFHNNIFYVVNDDQPYIFDQGKSIGTTFYGNTFYGNFINRPIDNNANEQKPDIVNEFPFHPDFPELLRKRVIDKLTQSLNK